MAQARKHGADSYGGVDLNAPVGPLDEELSAVADDLINLAAKRFQMMGPEVDIDIRKAAQRLCYLAAHAKNVDQPAQPAENPKAWKATYVRLIMNRNLDVTRKWAASEADYSWDHWNRERGDNPMPSPADAISEDKHEWMTR
jgi:hypothetical protein